MQLFLVLLVAIGIVAVWWWRMHGARRTAPRPAGRPGGARIDTRRMMEAPASGAHPADQVDDPRLAAAGIVVAVATMDGPISLAEIGRLKSVAQETFGVSEREALELVSFARWIAGECTSNGEAVRRLSKIVLKTAGPDAGPDLVRMIEEVAGADGGELGPEERDAVRTVRRTLKMEPAGRRRG